MSATMKQDAYGCGGDWHMNLFCVYNKSYQFIENNLTRAWIHTLRLLSGKARNHLLKAVLRRARHYKRGDMRDFSNATFRLQGNIERKDTRKRKHKRILAIATHELEEILTDGEKAKRTSKNSDTDTYEGSIPDAWLYDAKEDYAYLVESKIGVNPLTDSQLKQEAKDWLGYGTSDAKDNTRVLTWFDVVEAVDEVERKSWGELNEQERRVLAALREYLGFYDYWLFSGFELGSLESPPQFTIQAQPNSVSFRFEDLANPPTFHLSAGEDSKK